MDQGLVNKGHCASFLKPATIHQLIHPFRLSEALELIGSLCGVGDGDGDGDGDGNGDGDGDAWNLWKRMGAIMLLCKLCNEYQCIMEWKSEALWVSR